MKYETGTFEFRGNDMMMRELSSAETNEVAGGGAAVSASLVGDAVVNGAFHLDNLPGVFSIAEIAATIQPFSGTPTLTLMASANTSN